MAAVVASTYLRWVSPVRYFSCVSRSGNSPVLTLYTKRDEECSLCEIAKSEIQAVGDSKFMYEEVYIDDPKNTEWFNKYRYDIPVVHINGEFLMKHRVDRKLLEKKLEQLLKANST